MFKNYTVQTFTAWWIGASVGFLLAQLTVGEGHWNGLSTAVLTYTLVLYVIYLLTTARGERLIERVKGYLARADPKV